MCSASLVPMPSSTGWPKRAAKRRCRSAGRASPAVTVARTEANVDSGTSVSSRPATKPGLAKNSVGCSVRTSSATSGGVGRRGLRIAVAPTANGNVSELPSPKAKNSLATERQRSSGPIDRTSRAYVSAVACGLPWRCMTPFGVPVVPEL